MSKSCTKKGKLLRRIISIILVAAMELACLPQMCLVAKADTSSTGEEVMSLPGRYEYDTHNITPSDKSAIALYRVGPYSGKYGDMTSFNIELLNKRLNRNGVLGLVTTTDGGMASVARVGNNLLNGKGKALDAAGTTNIGSNVSVAMNYLGLERSNIVRVGYVINNNSDSEKQVTVGGVSDLFVAMDDTATVETFETDYSAGLYSVAKNGAFLAFSTDGDFWFGEAGTNLHKNDVYTWYIDKADGKHGTTERKQTGTYDSAMSWMWRGVSVPAHSSVTKYCYFGVGSLASGENPNMIMAAGAPAYIEWDENVPWYHSGAQGMPENGISPVDRNGNITLINLTRNGYVFDGWYDRPAGGTKVGGPGDVYNTTENVTLYAYWHAVVSTVNIDLKMGTEPYEDQTMQLYDSYGLKYSLKESDTVHGTYSVGGVENKTYEVGVNGVRTGDTITVAADGSDSSTWTKTVTVTLKKVSVNTKLDGNLSSEPGEVTLRQNGRIVYTLKERDAGKYAMGIIFGTNTTFDVFVGDLDTGVDVTPDALTHTIDYHTSTVMITDDAAWDNAGVVLKNSTGKTVARLSHDSTSGTGTTYTAIVQDSETAYSVWVDGVDTKEEVTIGTLNDAAVSFHTATLDVSCTDAAGLPLSATIKSDDGARRYALAKGTPAANTVSYTADHVLDKGDYKIFISGVSGSNPSGYAVSGSDPQESITVCVVDYKKYETTDNETFTAASSGVKDYVVSGGKASLPEMYLAGFTFDGWSENEWTRSETSYTSFDRNTAINENKTLYPHYLSATVKINGFVRTDANGTPAADGGYYTMPDFTVAGFDTGSQSVKYVVFNGTNVDSITALGQSDEVSFDSTMGILTFTHATSMAEARDYVRNNIIVEPSKSGSDHLDGSMSVMVVDKNGTAAAAASGGAASASMTSASLPTEGGSVLLDGGFYIISSDTEITGSGTADTARERSGLIVPDNGSVYILVQSGVTLTVNGGAASDGGTGATGETYTAAASPSLLEGCTGTGGTGGIGAGAGIYVPEGASLVLLGEGSIIAQGGSGGNGGNGGNAGISNGYRETTLSRAGRQTNSPNKDISPYYKPVESAYASGGGGGGGAGGGGAGAGIGGAGGNGGNGGAGGQARIYLSGVATAGSDGSAGDDGTACGTIINKIGNRLSAAGGTVGTEYGNGGNAGEIEKSICSTSDTNRWDQVYTDFTYGGSPASAAAGGGGGGAIGSSSVGIGSGGAGGGGAGGGGAGFIGNANRIGGYAAGGGNGGVGAGGASGGTGEGIKGSQSSALAGGDGGAAGAASAETTPSTDFTFSITCNAAETGDSVGTYDPSYTPGTELSFQFPTYTAGDSSVVIKGWMITKYGLDINGSSTNPFTSASTAVYPAGGTATIPDSTLGNLEFSPVTFHKSGLTAEDTLAYDGTTRSLTTYKVNTLVNNVPTDVGPLTFGSESVRGLNGVYTIGSSLDSVTVKFNGSTIASLTGSDPEATVKFEKIKVKVTGKEPSEVTLSDEGTAGPALTCTERDETNNVYIYESGYRVEAADKGDYAIHVDGESTGVSTSYGSDVAEVRYHTITIDLSPSNADIVTLQDEDGNILVMEKTETASHETVFTYTSLHDEVTSYDVYADGTKTSASGNNAVKFDGNTGAVTLGYYVTTVTVKLNDSVSDVPGIPYYGNNPMVRKETGVYTYASSSSTAQPVSVRTAVNAIASLAAGGTGTVDFYTVTYTGSGDLGETGTAPEVTYCLKNTATELAINTFECGAMIFGGWRIDGTVYPVGSTVSISEPKTATPTWSANSLNGITENGKCAMIVFDSDVFAYDGTEQKPTIQVYMGDTLLTENSDYTLSFSNDNTDTGAGDECVRAGKVTVTVTGTGSYSGQITKDYKILKRVVCINNITAIDRPYNGTTDVVLSDSSVTLGGVATSDNGDHSKLWFSGSLTGSVNDANVETVETPDANAQDVETIGNINYIKKDVTIKCGADGITPQVTLTGTSSSNYILSGIGGAYNSITEKNDPVNVLITKKEIMPVSIGVHDKAYDGTTNAEIIEGSAVFNESDIPASVAEKLTVTGVASFVDDSVGTSKTVNITGLTLGGQPAGNYKLTSESMTSTADIVKAAQLAPAPGEGYEIENAQIKVGSSTDSFTDGKNYEILWVHNNPTDEMTDYQKSGTVNPGASIDNDPDKTYYIRIKGDDTHEPSPYTRVVTDVPEGKKIASLPMAVEGLVYTEGEQTGVRAGDGYTLTGNTAIDVGDYVAMATLVDGYVWPDKTTEALNINWTISKKTQSTPANVYADTDTDPVSGTPVNVIRYPYPGENGQILSYSPDNGTTWYTLPTGTEGETLRYSTDGGKTWNVDTNRDLDNITPGKLEGVADNTTYQFRYIEDEHNYASPASLVTVGAKIVIPKTLAPSRLTDSGVTLRGSVESTTGITGAGFKYRKAGDTDWTEVTQTVGLSFSKPVTGLEPDTDYEYCAFVNVTAAENIGNIVRFHTPETAPEEAGEITVSVSNQTGDNTITAEVTVEYGNDVVATTTTQTIVNGGAQSVSFKNLPYGYYNVVVRAGDYTETRMLSVESDIAVSAAFTIPKGKLSTEVIINDSETDGAETPKVAVEGLNDIITDSDKNSAAVGQCDVSVKLVVEKKGTATEGANAIRQISGTDTLVSFIDMNLFKTVTRLDAAGKPVSVDEQNIGDSNKKVLEIAIPIGSLAEKSLCIYRYHANKAEKLKSLYNRPIGGVFKDGTYYRDPTGWMFLYASGFSTYVIAYPRESSGGGGGTPTEYTPIITQPENGNISINPENPGAGDTVIITVTPEEDYEIDSVTVKDKDGNIVEVTKYEDGTYAFTQPASGPVSIVANIIPRDAITVHFDLNGKVGIVPDTQVVEKNGKAVRPDDPIVSGFEFTAWYTEPECINLYDFDTEVTESITLYAGWKQSGSDEEFGISFVELFDDPYDGVYYNVGKDRYEIVYTGAPIKPLIRVTSKADGMLKEGIDYSVSYSNNRNYSKKKPAAIRVSGRGFYKSKKVLELYILQADLEKAYDKGLIAGADEFKVLNGSKLNPMIVYRGYKLAGRDRDISNKNKITGDTTTDITGKGNFTGALKDVPVKVISRDDQKKGAIKVNLKAGKHVYNGKAHKLSVTTEKEAGELTVTAGSNKTLLIEDTDFVVSYSGNTNAGKATVTITGIGKCSGTVVKNFTIQPDKTIDITAELADTAPVYFNVRGARPDIKVTAHRKAEDETVTEEILKEGKDYKVSYSSNKKVGKGTYTVKFINNYKGHKAVTGKYDIVPAGIDEARVEAVQMIYKKPGKYLPKPYVSLDGVQLKNSDYTYKYYLGEEEITSKYKLSLADDETIKTVKIVVIGKGNYTNTTAEGTYDVVRRTADAIDLSRARIVARDKNKKGRDVAVAKQEYTGYEIEPEIRVMARINRKWVDVDPSLYSVSYINNVNKGSATILVTGNGKDTIGSRTTRFSINTMRFELFRLIFRK